LIQPLRFTELERDPQDLGAAGRQILIARGLIEQRVQAYAGHGLGGADGAGELLRREGEAVVDPRQHGAVQQPHGTGPLRRGRALFHVQVGHLGNGRKQGRRGALDLARRQRGADGLHHGQMQRGQGCVLWNLRRGAEQRPGEREEDQVVVTGLAQQIEAEQHLIDVARGHLAQDHRLLPVGHLVIAGDAVAHQAASPGGVVGQQQAIDPGPGAMLVVASDRHHG
jgi:hypothetical protein